MKIQFAKTNDVNNVLELAHFCKQDVDKIFLEDALKKHRFFYVAYDNEKLVGSLIYNMMNSEVEILMLITHPLHKIEIMRRLLHVVNKDTIDKVFFYVKESDVDMQIMLRDSMMGYKCKKIVEKNNETYYKFIKRSTQKAVHANRLE